ncbi:MAG: pilus assembly protein N-terminal domain-containing protein [Acidobacteria bacterium]|nr:pilus assembly protein N-terminal domain-containing protein [Acidobacteriota bacterium]
MGILLTAGAVGSSGQEVPAAETQTLHVLVGKSVVINMEARLRRILVSNPVAVEAVATTPSQLVVTAKAPGGSSLILWDEEGRSRLLDVLVDLDVSTLRDSIQSAYPSEPIQVQADASRVIVSGTVSDTEVIENVLKMAGIYSNNVVNSLTLGVPAHERQILLEVKFAEVDRTRLDQLGFNILSTGTLNTPGAISTQQFGPPSVGQTGIQSQIGASLAGTETNFSVTDILNVFLFRPDINLATTIRALEQNSVLQILAEPNLMALSGRPARFLAGGEFPFPVVQGGTNFTAVTIQFRPFGVRLEFTGYITKDDVIRMQVSPEVSTLDFTNALTISGFLVPAVSTRKAETEIELRDGQTFGIAGLMDQRTQATMSKIPGIGDLPIIGRLFRSKSANRSRTELLVLVTPRIVDPVREEFEAPAAPRPALRDLVVPEFDSGIPKGERPKPPAEESAPQK